MIANCIVYNINQPVYDGKLAIIAAINEYESRRAKIFIANQFWIWEKKNLGK